MLNEVSLSYSSWKETRETLHRYLQLVGKLRLALSPRRNHWWNVPFHLTGTGLTTRPMGREPIFAVDFDFLDHRLIVTADDGGRASFSLADRSVAEFQRGLEQALSAVGVDPAPIGAVRPFALPDSERPFSDDTDHADYDRDAVTTYWRMLAEVNMVLEEFSGRFSGKSSPVHHFWHSMDIAMTRYSDATVQHDENADAVTREAYSRHVISFGFWFGDESYPEPAFYSYISPEPEGLAASPLPGGAQWLPRGSSHLATLSLGAAQTSGDVAATALEFFEAAYQNGAAAAGWDIERYASPNGVTDPGRGAG
ncbi:DUF5996 family protein [Microbacterium sp. DT81.1]|uniref:DUF5996 family protein n=1 Tax=Microbacterium sp. DT81.1 TaxID=3393413 RepID=UPI003CEBACC5